MQSAKIPILGMGQRLAGKGGRGVGGLVWRGGGMGGWVGG